MSDSDDTVSSQCETTDCYRKPDRKVEYLAYGSEDYVTTSYLCEPCVVSMERGLGRHHTEFTVEDV
jgi:hypothetical protein